MPTSASNWPSLSVVMPVLNEERHLAQAVARVLDQDYPGRLQVVLAVAPSGDGTAAVAAQLVRQHPQVCIVPNPSGITPEGLNAAIAASDGSIVARVDGHAEISRGYLRHAVRCLQETGAANVGGIMDATGVTPFEKAVACAMKSVLGVGGSRFHTGGQAGVVDTVYLGVFRRDALAAIGGYDPHFQRAQDWEMNHRLRLAGELVWFDPQLRVTYRPRATLLALAQQYYGYGRWRRVVARRHAGTANARYLAPPAMVLGCVGGAVLGAWWHPAWLVPVTYFGSVAVGGLLISRRESWSVRRRTPLVVAVMHWSWGWGFLTSPRSLSRSTRSLSRSTSAGVGRGAAARVSN